MLVTINTDASFHPVLKYGGYAFWAISNDFKITKSGVFRKKCLSPDDAEAKCIINALQVVFATPKGITKVIVNTDSLNAIAILKGDKTHIRKYIYSKRLAWIKLRSIYKKVLIPNVKIEYRHVKAHSGVKDKRSFVNEWCDSEAKKSMWKAVNKSKKEKEVIHG